MSTIAWGPLFFMLLINAGGNELLDYMPAQTYWQQQGVESVTLEALTPHLDAQATTPAEHVRKLMAIRALAGVEGAAARLEPLARSNDPFIASTAQRALAAARNEAWTAPQLDEAQRNADLALLLADVGIVGQVLTSPATSLAPIEAVIPQVIEALPDAQRPDPQQMRQILVQQLATQAHQFGNARVDALTFGVSRDIGPNSGSVVVIARGRYDHQAAQAYLRQQTGDKVTQLGQVTFIELNPNALVVFPSAEQAVLVTGPNPADLPLEALAAALQQPPAQPQWDESVAAVVQPVDRSGQFWVAGRLSPAMRDGPLDAFEQFSLSGRHEEGVLQLSFEVRGHDAARVQAVMHMAVGGIQQAAAGMRQGMDHQPHLTPMIRPMVDLFESIQITSDADGVLRATGRYEGHPWTPLIGFFGISSRATVPSQP